MGFYKNMDLRMNVGFMVVGVSILFFVYIETDTLDICKGERRERSWTVGKAVFERHIRERGGEGCNTHV